MANENYTRLLKEVNERRKILRVPKNKFQDIKKYLEYLAENEYALEWAELGKSDLFPYERRTLGSIIEREKISSNFSYFSIESVKQYLCPCCEAMTAINLDISGNLFHVIVSYNGIIGKELTLQKMLEFQGIDESAELKTGVI